VAITLFGITGLAELVIVLVTWRRKALHTRRTLATLLAATAASSVAVSWTSLAGGRINHPEVQKPGDQEAGPAHPH